MGEQQPTRFRKDCEIWRRQHIAPAFARPLPVGDLELVGRLDKLLKQAARVRRKNPSLMGAAAPSILGGVLSSPSRRGVKRRREVDATLAQVPAVSRDNVAVTRRMRARTLVSWTGMP